jgi:hypothetical protein
MALACHQELMGGIGCRLHDTQSGLQYVAVDPVMASDLDNAPEVGP